VQLLIFELHLPSDHVTLDSSADLGETVLHEIVLTWTDQLKLYALRTVVNLGDWVGDWAWSFLRLFL